MSISRARFQSVRRSMVTLSLVAASIWGPSAFASDGTSSPEDRRRFVTVARNLEQAPLKLALKPDREWALAWLTDAPDVTVTLCADALAGMLKSKYRYAGEIILQNSFSMAAFVIEHPEMANDPNAQQVAGMEGALAAYRSILRDHPEATSSALETLIKTQSRGELPAAMKKAWIRCSAKPAEDLR
jgi:hypothetical protein